MIDNQYWKDIDATSSLLELTNSLSEQLVNGDQEVLNRFFAQKWLRLDDTYNYQIGFDQLLSLRGEVHPTLSRPIMEVPLIIHYLSSDKPWNTFSSHRLRDIWWYYQGLDWSELILSSKRLPLSRTVSDYTLSTDIVIVTDTQDIPYLEELLKAFPNLYFHVLAYTPMGPKLLTLSAYSNLVLHPAVSSVHLQELLSACSLYLAIHKGYLFEEVINFLVKNQKPVLAFNYVETSDLKARVFEPHDKGLVELIDAISDIFPKK